MSARGEAGEETGTAAVIVVVLAAFLVLVTAGMGAFGRLIVDQRRVEAAADLAALAGATALQRGVDPCGYARQVADRNGAGLLACQASGEQVRVTATVSSPLLLGRHFRVTAEARAGPVD